MPVDLSVFHRAKTVDDFNRAAQEHALKQQMLNIRAQGGATIQAAQMLMSSDPTLDFGTAYSIAKSGLGQGVAFNGGQAQAIPGYQETVAQGAGMKKGYEQQAAKNVDLDMLPKIEGAKVDSKIKAENKAKAEVGLPAADAQSNEILNVIDGIENDPGLSAVVGLPNPLKGRIPLIGNVAGSPAADFQAKLDQLGGKQFLEAFSSLKGGGQITEIEGQKATNAIARMQTAQSEKAFREALSEFKGVVQSAQLRARTRAGVPSNSSIRVINPKSGEIYEIPKNDFPSAQAEGFRKL